MNSDVRLTIKMLGDAVDVISELLAKIDELNEGVK
jgi:hypothetical protein